MSRNAPAATILADPRWRQVAHLRLGVVDYLNMLPLIAGLEELGAGRGPRLRHGPPSELTRWLERGEADVAMAPVGGIFAHPEWRVLEGSAIGSRGPVRSVLMLGDAQPGNWRALRPDSHSMTSNALARVVLSRRYGCQPAMGEAVPREGWQPPERPAEGEGLVLIGSRALRWGDVWRGNGARASRVDLGEAWFELTGLPFVFAVWAVREGVETGPLGELLNELAAENLRETRRLTGAWPRLAEDGLSEAEAARYLSENIRYGLDAEARAGLEAFYVAGREMGLFPAGWALRYGKGAGARG